VSVILLRGDARELPLPDESVDLIVTSPPYWSLRSYTDGGEHYEGQIGSEKTPQEWVAAMLECTREWMRVLKPSGSMFVNLGDKYNSGPGDVGGDSSKLGYHLRKGKSAAQNLGGDRSRRLGTSLPPKSLIGLPWRYALACMDDLGLILRKDNIWHKTNPLPESADDRCATKHEYIFHFTMRPRYYSAVDEIREPQSGTTHPGRTRSVGNHSGNGAAHRTFAGNTDSFSPLGKLPGSVWEIPSQPLNLPGWLPADHFAAFPLELPRRCILGWSPPGICTACGEGRRPVADVTNVEDRKGRRQRIVDYALDGAHGPDGRGGERWKQTVRITGYVCACTPFTDHPGNGETTRCSRNAPGTRPQGTYGRKQAGEYERVGPWREYHFGGWLPAPTRPAVVLDPFGGTGCTALVADVLGRTGISVDLSMDYARIARWRTSDPGERARALQVPKPPPVSDGQTTLFDGMEATA
jgi:DNA modification methylase